jgi:hypothetical protein
VGLQPGGGLAERHDHALHLRVLAAQHDGGVLVLPPILGPRDYQKELSLYVVPVLFHPRRAQRQLHGWGLVKLNPADPQLERRLVSTREPKSSEK